MTNPDRASAEFSLGYSCAQSVLRAFSAELGLDPATAARVAGAFGGGMGRSGRTCGAVTGALMVLGLRFASPDAADKAAKERTYALARRFIETFAARHGSTDCPGLLACDIGTADGMQQARERDLFHTLCPEYVRDAGRILDEILAESVLNP